MRAAKIYSRIVVLYAMAHSQSGCSQFTISSTKLADILEIQSPQRALEVAEESCEICGIPTKPTVTGLQVNLAELLEKDVKAQALEVFEYWRVQSGKLKSKPTKARQSKIMARLREGYSVADLKQAVDGLVSSPWHRGENEDGRIFLDLELITRAGPRVEKFMAIGERKQATDEPKVFMLMRGGR
jgi:uncharacterized phage protein (TIGR02220 family)